MGLLTGLVLMALVELMVPDEEEQDVAFYRRVRDLVSSSFVRELDDREILDHALRGMVEGLDPYSRYYTAEDLPRMDRETEGRYRGIGVVFDSPVSAGRVLFPMSNSPADRAGLTVGDRMLEINGLEVAGMPEGGLQEALREPPDGELDLLVEGLDGARRRVSLSPEPVVDPTVRHTRILDRDRGIGYLAIRSFSRQTPAEFDAEIAALEQQELRALVLDLRGNPGGVLDAAVQVANRFIASGVIVTTASRAGTLPTEADEDVCALRDLPLAVLVDADTASASEVLAGALQDHRVGVLVGDRTYGKGAVQSLVRFDQEGVRVKLTTSYYATPAHRIIERELADRSTPGLSPDLLVPVSPLERRRIYEHLDSYSPPAESWQAIELSLIHI